MSQPIDYQGCLHALAKSVSQSVVALQMACSPDSASPAAGEPSLLDAMRDSYAHNVKRLFECKKADEAVEREIGTAYGALITHLQAIHASWTVFKASNNKHIHLETMAQQFANQAVRAGEACYETAVEAVCKLMKADALVHAKAEVFIDMVNAHVKKVNLQYRSNPHSTYGWGYSPMGVYASDQTRKKVSFGFCYWDGVDAIMADLGSLFFHEPERKLLVKFATMAFGGPVRFTSDFSAIEFDEPTV